MKVIDAGVLVELIASDLDPEVLGDEELAVPHLVDTEVLSALRALVGRRELTTQQGSAAVDLYGQLELVRFPAENLRSRIWGLRHNLSAYDATYVALAESLGSNLLTTDTRIAAAPGTSCVIEVV
ncbi:MAG TPA: type II toxin-antitoxin system VapC family toxin [Acidimicrobiales bacterium]